MHQHVTRRRLHNNRRSTQELQSVQAHLIPMHCHGVQYAGTTHTHTMLPCWASAGGQIRLQQQQQQKPLPQSTNTLNCLGAAA
jgi:membrane protein required for beta-lactamase induction